MKREYTGVEFKITVFNNDEVIVASSIECVGYTSDSDDLPIMPG